MEGHSENFRALGPPGAEKWPFLCGLEVRPGRAIVSYGAGRGAPYYLYHDAFSQQ